jgi:hypothetical protein
MQTKRKMLKTTIITKLLTNKKRTLHKVLIGLITLAIFIPLTAQTDSSSCEVNNYAFKAGEHITFDLYFNWKFIWKKAGTASLSTRSMTYRSQPAYMVNLLATSNGLADKFFQMRDTLTSIVSTTLQPLYYRKAADEGGKFTIDEVRYTERGGKYAAKMKRVKNGKTSYASGSESKPIYDMLSIISRVRSINPSGLKEGQRLIYPIASGKHLDNETLIFKGRQRVKAENGTTYRCMKFTLVERQDNKQKDIITFYITDDLNHLPIRLDLALNFGTAKAYMRSVENVRHPFTSIVK